MVNCLTDLDFEATAVCVLERVSDGLSVAAVDVAGDCVLDTVPAPDTVAAPFATRKNQMMLTMC
jgi:hypothetical protein